jgi:class 3 adenylate cyclase
VIGFTDIVGSTELLSRVGDDAFDELRRSHFDLLVHQVEAHGGEIVKNLGDGVMLAFGSASDAVAAAVGMQRAVDVAARGAGADPITIRVGIAAGDATLPRPRRRTQLTVGFAHLTSTRSSIATAPATPSPNSPTGSESTRPR